MAPTRRVVAASIAGVLCLAVTSPARAQRDAGAPATAAEARAALDRYCVTCHNERLRTAGLTLDTVDPGQVADAPAQAVSEVAAHAVQGLAPAEVGHSHPETAVLERDQLGAPGELGADRAGPGRLEHLECSFWG